MIRRTAPHCRAARRSQHAVHWLALLALCASVPAAAERRPVLEQVDLPHPYYWRELYLPQLTAGPSSLSWSPDSKELIYSMAGTLWRQRLDSPVAQQLTDGAGLDYQPDWSPDGGRVVYCSYQKGAIELWLLDLKTRRSTQLTHDGAVNVEPRWSPDGRELVYVTTAGTQHFHVHVAELSDGRLVHDRALFTDSKSPLRRYYYSAYDHEINPTWSRDGKDILFVSNRGHVHGTGGLWRIPVAPGGEAREIRYEETNWRARPDVSPDGTTLVYSSYLGRNHEQLWLLPANGGDPLPITYGESDATQARWSPDGRQVAYVSNEDGDLSLRVLDYPGSTTLKVAPRERQTLRPHADLELRVEDPAGHRLPARVSVTDGRGHPYVGDGSWLHSDDSYDRAEANAEVRYFHVTGTVHVQVPAEPVTITVSHGLETAVVQKVVTPVAGRASVVTVVLHPEPFRTDPSSRWVSGDAHVHMNYAGAYRNTPAHLADQAAAEDLSIVNALVVNKEQRFPDLQFAGPAGNASRADVLVVHGQEFHSSYWGHLGILHPDGGLVLPGYAGYPNTAAASLAPMNATVADLAHAEGALVGYVHPFDELPDPVARPGEALTSELPVDVALGKVDYIEVLGFSDHRATASIWYRLLNLGFKLPAAAGTDAMADYASLRGPVGLNRVYVQVPDGALELGAWLDGLRGGRTFATNGPLLSLELDGHGPGSTLELSAVTATAVPFRARLRSLVAVEHLEIVCNGKVVRQLIDAPKAVADVTGTLPVATSGWCVLRADSASSAYPVLDNYLYGTTSPVYLAAPGARLYAPEDARFFVAWIERVLESTEAYPDWRSSAEKAEVLRRLREAQAVYRALQ